MLKLNLIWSSPVTLVQWHVWRADASMSMMRPFTVFSVAVDTHLTCHPAVSMVTTCFFPPPFRFQCHPASPATAYRQGKNSDCVDGLSREQLVCLRFVWLITCTPSLALAHPLTLACALAIMHVVELSADRGMHRLRPVHAAAKLQKANVDQRETVCASILWFLWWKLNVPIVVSADVP